MEGGATAVRYEGFPRASADWSNTKQLVCVVLQSEMFYFRYILWSLMHTTMQLRKCWVIALKST